ncbi:MAG: hypothetical protein ACYCZN_16385, partial [Candidatus Dormibacteria bacterium]
MGGRCPVVQWVVGAGAQLQQLGHACAHQLVEPVGHVPDRLGFVAQAVSDGVARRGVGRRVLGCRPAVQPKSARRASKVAASGLA